MAKRFPRRAQKMINQQNAQKKDFAAKPSWWKWLIGVVLLPIFIVFLTQTELFKNRTPQFGIANNVLRPDSAIVILPNNKSAEKPQPLDVKFDSLIYLKAGEYIGDGETHRWQFSLPQDKIIPAMRKDGYHEVRVRFPGEAFSEVMPVVFNTKAPVVKGTIASAPENPRNKTISGIVASHSQLAADTVEVNIYFHHNNYPYKIPVPVGEVKTDDPGRYYFEFQTQVQDVPEIAPEDSLYDQPFFALEVMDKAGNKVVQRESYAKFIAPGASDFQINDMAMIQVEHLPPDLRKNQGQVAIRIKQVSNANKTIEELANGQPPIVLKVTPIAVNVNDLEWSNLPESLRTENPLTVIFRDGKEIAVSFENQYRDEEVAANETSIYQVEQVGKDGKRYRSNKATGKEDSTEQDPPPVIAQKDSLPQLDLSQPLDARTNSEGTLDNNLNPIAELRVSPNKNLTGEAVGEMIKKFDFFCQEYGWTKDWVNPSGKGYPNNYKVKIFNEDIVVVDYTSGLMWQQSGSGSLRFSEAAEYIQKLNKEKFAGYDDWRLPTLEEAMSLMEPEKKSGLYIDESFNRKQQWIWTADVLSASSAWFVDFDFGSYGRFRLHGTPCIRAVRSDALSRG